MITRPHHWRADGEAKRCACCGMLSTWAGAKHSCEGVYPPPTPIQLAHRRKSQRADGLRQRERACVDPDFAERLRQQDQEAKKRYREGIGE